MEEKQTCTWVKGLDVENESIDGVVQLIFFKHYHNSRPLSFILY